MAYVPIGITFLEAKFNFGSSEKKRRRYKIWIWMLTFWVYTTYHLSRKPISVVKNVLNQNCSKLIPPHNINNSHWCDWKPFDKDDSSSLLGIMDFTYLFTYAFGMFMSGFIAERSNLSVFLCIGMVSSGLLTAAFGLGKTFQVHYFSYYIIIQLMCGLVQSTGWPGVVTTMGNWFGKKKRGFIMGLWNSHTSLGNILGTLIANAYILSGWDLSFVVPGTIIAVTGIVVLFFLVPEPSMVYLPNVEQQFDLPNNHSFDESQHLLDGYGADSVDNETHPINLSVEIEPKSAISFCEALRIPGVRSFSGSLFFSKLVSYTFLYWLPHFILESTNSNPSQSAYISTFFDIGGIMGGILAGIANDTTKMPGSTCTVMLFVSTLLLFVYQRFCHTLTTVANAGSLVILGLFVNGPYALITTAVSAELGTHNSLQGNSKALSTVTSIIDGTGSLGAAIGPLLAGVVSYTYGWETVFLGLMLSNVASVFCLLRTVFKEVKQWRTSS